jgi:hypothetical protein
MSRIPRREQNGRLVANIVMSVAEWDQEDGPAQGRYTANALPSVAARPEGMS